VIVLLVPPPLYACRLTSRRPGLKNVTVPLVIPGPLKLTLFVGNCPYGLERYQAPLPQSTSPVGY
jgi:hypothetical protein